MPWPGTGSVLNAQALQALEQAILPGDVFPQQPLHVQAGGKRGVGAAVLCERASWSKDLSFSLP